MFIGVCLCVEGVDRQTLNLFREFEEGVPFLTLPCFELYICVSYFLMVESWKSGHGGNEK